MKTAYESKGFPASRLKRMSDELVLGIDGGGTRTRAIITDGKGEVLGEGVAGPSNPLRVGITGAVSAVREATDKACAAAAIQRSDIASAVIGLAGVKAAGVRSRMREALGVLGVASLEVVTDAEIALFGATGGKPGVVVIAGTGSVCYGMNAKNQRAYAGGWGPMAGDEGSGAWIARRALQAIAKAADGRGPETSLSQAACAYFNVATVEELSTAIYAPALTNERIAGFSKHVIEAEAVGDEVSRGILVDAGCELGAAATAVIRRLGMERAGFQVAYVGGIFAAGEVLLKPLREEVARRAPDAFVAPPVLPPVVAAARMARGHLAARISAVAV